MPRQLIFERTGAILKTASITDAGDLDLKALERLISERTKMIALTHILNVLGTINPIAEITHAARQDGAKVLIDGAQAVSHIDLDLKH